MTFTSGNLSGTGKTWNFTWYNNNTEVFNQSNVYQSVYTSTKVFRSKNFTSLGGQTQLTITIPSGNPIRFLGTGTLSSDVVKENFIVINKSTGQILDFVSSGNTVSLSSNKKTVTFT